jgi:hypothetical protein
MPRTALTITDSSKAGTVLAAGTAADVANGNSVSSDGRSYVIIAQNSGVTLRTITITPTATVDGLVPAARTVTLASGVTKVLGPYDIANYSDTLQISADHAEVKFQVVRIPGF